MAGPAGMDHAFALLGPQADGNILDGPAETGHSVALEVGQHQVGIVVGKVFAYIVLAQMRSAADRDRHRAVLIQNDHIGNGSKAMILCHLVVHGGAGTLASVGGVALYDGAVHRLDNILNQFRAEVVAVWRFAGGQLYRDTSGWRPVQRLVDCHKPLRADVRSHVDGGSIGGVCVMLQGGKFLPLCGFPGNRCRGC